MKISIFPIFFMLLLVGCKKSHELKDIKGNNENKEITKTTNSNLDNDMNANNKSIKFSDLFNEGVIIKFTPEDLKSTTIQSELDFKKKLDLFEKETLIKDFDVENLSVLVNNETFTNSEYFINSNWLKYFIQKYDLSLSLNGVMDSAINQEDLSAVNIILSTGYIISKDELALALQSKESSIINKKINKESNGYDERGELIFYDDKKSRADEIFIILRKKYNYKIFDKDGYTNLRDDAMNSAYILGEIKSGTHINIIDNKDQKWLYIETSNGRKGYVHRSRIVSE